MSAIIEARRTLPFAGSKPNMGTRHVMPALKEPAIVRPVNQFKTKKIGDADVRILLQFLRETFEMEPTTSPAETISKLRRKISSTEDQNKKLKDQLRDHDVLLMAVQDELDLGPEFNPIRTSRAFKKYTKDSHDHTTHMQNTIKGNDALLRVCKEISGVSGQHAPEGLANFLRSSWSRKQHTLTKLQDKIAELKENGHSLSQMDSDQTVYKPILDLARVMGVETANKQIAAIVSEMKVTFTNMKDDVADMENMANEIKSKDEDIKELQHQLRLHSQQQPAVQPIKKVITTSGSPTELENLRSQDKTKTKRIVDLQKVVNVLKTKTLDLALDLENAQAKQLASDNLVFDFEMKVRDLEIDNDKKDCELEDMLQRYEQAGSMVQRLQTELNEFKENSSHGKICSSDASSMTDDSGLEIDLKIADLEEQKTALTSDLEDLLGEVRTKNKLIDDLQEELNVLNTENQELVQELEDAQAKQQDSDDIVCDFEAKVRALETYNGQKACQLEDMLQQKEEAESTIKQLQTDLDEFKENTKSLLSQSKKCLSDAFSMTDDSGLEIDLKIADLEEQKTALSSDLEDLLGEVRTKNKLIDDLQEELNDLNTENQELVQELEDAQAKQQDSDDIVCDFEAKVRALETYNGQKDCQLEDMLQRYEQAESTIEQLQTELDDVKEKYETLLCQTKTPDIVHNDSDAENQSATLAQLNEKVDELQRQKDISTAQLRRFEETQLSETKVQAFTVSQSDGSAVKLDKNIPMVRQQESDILDIIDFSESTESLTETQPDGSVDLDKNIPQVDQQETDLDIIDITEITDDEVKPFTVSQSAGSAADLDKNTSGVKQQESDILAIIDISEITENKVQAFTVSQSDESQADLEKNIPAVKQQESDILDIIDFSESADSEKLDVLSCDHVEVMDGYVDKAAVSDAMIESLRLELKETKEGLSKLKRKYEQLLQETSDLQKSENKCVTIISKPENGHQVTYDMETMVTAFSEDSDEDGDEAAAWEVERDILSQDLKKAREELAEMKASLAAASLNFGVTAVEGDTITITDLCRSFDQMKQQCGNLQQEIDRLRKTTGAGDKPSVDSGMGDKILGDTQNSKLESDLKDTVDDLKFTTFNQTRTIKKLTHQLSLFQGSVLKAKDALFDDMTYIDRAVVERIFSNRNGPIDVPKLDKVSPWTDDSIVNDGQIGQGSYGKVFLRRFNGEAVAMKVPYLKDGVKDEDTELRELRTRADNARTTKEALIHIALQDQGYFPKAFGIVNIHGSPSLVLEFIGDHSTGTVSSLSNAIKLRVPSPSRNDWFEIIEDIFFGVRVMHQLGFLHNDLKANNILLKWDEDETRWRAFIIDFGKVSTLTMPIFHTNVPVEEKERYKAGALFQHLAPEYILEQAHTSVHTDIYSLGKLLAKMERLIKSEVLRELAAAMANIKPRLRPSWKTIDRVIQKAKKKNVS